MKIRGDQAQLRRFQSDALPREGEQARNSWGGHSEGPLSFFSLLPPPTDLRCEAAVSTKPLWDWQAENWGCAAPQTDNSTLSDECLTYWFTTCNFCAHNFVVNVSRLYPQLVFLLVWKDWHSGGYGCPFDYALLAVQDGIIDFDGMEISGKHVTMALKSLGGKSDVFLDYELRRDESWPDPDDPPHPPDGSIDSIHMRRAGQDGDNMVGPTPAELEAAKHVWPSASEGQTVGDFLSAREDRVALVVEHGSEVAALYRCESVKHVAFLSYIDWEYDVPLSLRAPVLPWLAYVHRLMEERRAAATKTDKQQAMDCETVNQDV